MENQTPERLHSAYIGDIIYSLIKEATLWKNRVFHLEEALAKAKHDATLLAAENEQLKATAVQDNMQFLRER